MIYINESEFDLANGKKGKVAVFLYSGDEDPEPILNNAIRNFVGEYKNYKVFIDAHLNCPWMKTVVSNIDEMYQKNFDFKKHRMISRSQIIDKILKEI